MDERITRIIDLLTQTSSSLGKSFASYWPADDNNDPGERNVSLHFAHAMLSAGFSVFAEADHPNRGPILGIDIFGLSPCNEWFLGCEFKRLYSGEKLVSLAADVDRLSSFWLRTTYAVEKYGHQICDRTALCKTGYGLVGDLHWVSGRNGTSSILHVWTDPDRLSEDTTFAVVSAKLRALNAVLPESQVVIEYPTGNRYYLLAAIFPIVCPLPAI